MVRFDSFEIMRLIFFFKIANRLGLSWIWPSSIERPHNVVFVGKPINLSIWIINAVVEPFFVWHVMASVGEDDMLVFFIPISFEIFSGLNEVCTQFFGEYVGIA